MMPRREIMVGLSCDWVRLRIVKSLKVESPDRLADEVSRMVREGWFESENELVRAALAEFLRTRQAELQERFQREDIGWAVAEAKPKSK